MKRARISKSIYLNLFVFFLVIAFALEASAFTMLRWGQRTVQHELERSAGADVEFIKRVLLGEVKNIEGLMHQLINDETLTRFANLWMYLGASDYYMGVGSVKKRLATVVDGNSYLREATVYLPAAACAIGSVEYQRTDARDVAALIRRAYDLSHAVHEWEGRLYMRAVYPSNSTRRGVEPLFLLLVELNMDEIAALLERFYIHQSEFARLVNHRTGTVVHAASAPDRGALEVSLPAQDSFRGEAIASGRAYYVVAEHLPALDMSIERFVPMSDIMHLPRRFNLALVGLSVLLLLCLIGYSVYTYRSVKAPVQALVDAFHALELGHMDTRIDGRFSHEFSYLVRQFNQMVAHLGKLIEKEYVSEAVYLNLLEGGLVADMTDIYFEYVSDYIKSLLVRGDNVALNYVTFDGRLMGIPHTTTAPTDTKVLILRKDWLDALNLAVPTTIGEVVAVAQAFVVAKFGGEDTIGLVAVEGMDGTYGNLNAFFNGYGAFNGIWLDDGEGNLVYGSVQDEMKDALLHLQEMYAGGLINQDFAVTTAEAAQALIAGGKCGLFYAYYAPTAPMKTALETDEACEWIIVAPPGVGEEPATLQSTSNPTGYFFVSALCEHPEAIVKMQNLECELLVNDYYGYSTTYEDKFELFLYAATGIHQSIPRQNVLRQQEATAAYLTGELNFTSPLCEISYQRLLDAEGNRTDTNPFLWGPGSTFQIIHETYEAGRCLLDAYQTQMTETMTLKKSLLDTALTAAMQKVIMGEDIAVFEAAVADWYAQGGQTMVEEANAWYKK